MRIASQVLPQPFRKFPTYMAEGFIFEGLQFRLANADEYEELRSQYAAEQFFDYLDALAFIEREMLAKGGIQTFTVESLERFILSLSKIITHSLILPYGSFGLAGHYAEKRAYMVRETGIPGVQYAPITSEIYSEHNFQIIIKRDGQTAANHYKDFCQKLKRYLNTEAEELKQRKASLTPKDIFYIDDYDLDAAAKRAKLSEHPGYVIFRKIYDCAVEPRLAKQKVREFCQTVIAKINAKFDVAEIAATAFEFAHIHPLANGNGRESRALSNGFSMSYGQAPVDFEKDKAAYYQAVESGNSHAIVQLIKRLQTQVNPASLADELIDEKYNFHTYGGTNCRYAVIRDKGCLILVPVNDMAKYCELLTQKKRVLATFDRMPVPREVIEKELQYGDRQINALVYRRVDSDYCAQKAKKYQAIDPRIAGYYWVRAAELARELDQKQKAAELYLNAAKNAKNHHFYSFAYDCLLEAVQLIPNLGESEAGQLLKELNFVKEYRDKTFKELPPANATERRTWLQNLELRDKYFIVLDKLADLLKENGAKIAKMDDKFKDKCSTQGWQLYALRDSQFLLAVLNFDECKAELLQLFEGYEDIHLVPVKSGNKQSLGICFIPSDKLITQLGKILEQLNEYKLTCQMQNQLRIKK